MYPLWPTRSWTIHLPAPRPVVLVTTVEDTKKRKRVKEEDQPEDQSQKKKVALSSSRGRIYKVTENDEEMEENF